MTQAGITRGLRGAMALAAAAFAILACNAAPAPATSSGGLASSNPFAGQASASALGCGIYAQQCSDCHGALGRGDGIHAKHLTPAPADLGAPASKSKSDAQLFDRIWLGGAMPPYNSGMPAYKDILSRDQVWQTVSYVRSLSGTMPVACAAPGQGAGGSTAPNVATAGMGSAGGGAAGVASAGSGGMAAVGMAAAGMAAAGMPAAGMPAGGMASGGSSAAGASSAGSGGSPGAGGVAGSAGGTSGGSGAGAGGMTARAGSGGAAGGSSGAGPTQACMDWCACLEADCKSQRGYPFSSLAMCHERCARASAAELSCWSDQCGKVESAQAGLKGHYCEHGWGAHGLEEC